MNAIDLGPHPRAEFQDLCEEASRGLEDLDDVVRLSLLCYFACFGRRKQVNHVLLEGLNGTSKTELAKGVNRALLGPKLRAFYGLTGWDEYQRTAGSPDQTPADIVGGDVIGPGGSLRFREGPLLRPCLFYYADELNRSPPKTQAVLLEAMAERRATINTLDPDRQAERIRKLPNLFLFASQNPDYHEGTFPLPEAQLDRFMVKVTMPYTRHLARLLTADAQDSPYTPEDEKKLMDSLRDPEREALVGGSGPGAGSKIAALGPLEERLLAGLYQGPRLAEARPALGFLEDRLLAERVAELEGLKDEVRKVQFPPEVAEFTENLVYWTWPLDSVRRLTRGIEGRVSPEGEVARAVEGVAQGASPRGAFALRDLACALAWARGEPAAGVEHVEAVALPVLGHRVILKFQATMGGGGSREVIETILRMLARLRRGSPELGRG